MGADTFSSTKVECAWVPVVAVVVGFAVLGAVDGKMDAFTCDCITAIRRAAVVIIAIST